MLGQLNHNDDDQIQKEILNFIGIVFPKLTSLKFVSSGIIPNRLATSW